jgi:hypothetical protein
MKESKMQFKNSTETKYWEMLGMLPPAIQTGHGFLVGEPMNHNSKGEPCFTAFVEKAGGQFFESKQAMTVDEFKALNVSEIS